MGSMGPLSHSCRHSCELPIRPCPKDPEESDGGKLKAHGSHSHTSTLKHLIQLHLSMGPAAALKKDATPAAFAQAAEAGLKAIQHYGGAKPGNRTMLDALAPATAALKDTLSQGAASAKDTSTAWPTIAGLVQCSQACPGNGCSGYT